MFFLLLPYIICINNAWKCHLDVDKRQISAAEQSQFSKGRILPAKSTRLLLLSESIPAQTVHFQYHKKIPFGLLRLAICKQTAGITAILLILHTMQNEGKEPAKRRNQPHITLWESSQHVAKPFPTRWKSQRYTWRLPFLHVASAGSQRQKVCKNAWKVAVLQCGGGKRTV